ncbi:metallophosphoesterase [Chitinophaga defluvii]|uniref:Metallophosphoesterase n=1 Tax=Chitinophaga defluvii TaxID=3163343 RepID=A0ABV2TA72_9BACT
MLTKLSYSLLVLALFFIHIKADGQTAKPLLRFGVMADMQYADQPDHGTRYYRTSLVKMDSCIANLNQESLAFNMVFGDLVDKGPKDLPPVMDRLKQLKAGFYNLLGNHDYVAVKERDVLYKQFEMPASYYTFEKANWMFIILNTNELSEYGINEGAPLLEEWKELTGNLKKEGRKNVQPWNGGISKRQLAWLENNLKKAKKKRKNVLVFTHHPLFPENGYETLNNRAILAVLEKYTQVKGILSGHHHEGGFAYYNNLPAITLEGMIETPDQNAYGVVELYPDKMVLTGWGRMTSRTLPLK